jgi:hypothetical protein
MCATPNALTDIAHVLVRVALIFHDARAANDFQVGEPGKPSQNFILYSAGEKSVLFVFAQVLEGKHRDAFFRNG